MKFVYRERHDRIRFTGRDLYRKYCVSKRVEKYNMAVCSYSNRRISKVAAYIGDNCSSKVQGQRPY